MINILLTIILIPIALTAIAYSFILLVGAIGYIKHVKKKKV